MLWMIGVYVEIVEKEVVQKGCQLNVQMATGIFKQKKLMSRRQAIPDLGIIHGIDTDSVGVG